MSSHPNINAVIGTDWLGETMAAQAREILPARHPWALNPEEPVYLVEYLHGAFVELGFYGDAKRAKEASDIGKWFPLPDGGWRSENSRTLILTDAQFTAARAAKAKLEAA